MSTPVASLPIAVPTMTLGRAWVHDLDVKIAKAKNAGFQGLEIFWEDLVCAAKKINPTSTEKDEAAMLRATRYTKKLCEGKNHHSNRSQVLDTYQILGRIYGDPTSATGKQIGAEQALATSLKEMVAVAPALLPKLFYVQLSRAEFMRPPLSPTHPFYNPAQKPRMTWSRNARLFPCESDRGGYLPVGEVAKVLFEDIGYRGWISMEVFSRTMSEPDKEVSREHAR